MSDSAATIRRPRRVRPWAVALTALLLACAAAPLSAEEGVPPRLLQLEAHSLESPPVLDGQLSEWRELPPEATARLERPEQVLPQRRAGWAGPADASAVVQVAVHGDALYLAARIEDEVLLHDPAAPWWHGDSLELFLDVGREAGAAPRNTYGPGCWQILLMPLNPSLRWGVVFRGAEMVFDDGGLRGLALAHRRRPGGYDLEARIPLDALGVESGAARVLGFGLALNDADEGPAEPGTYLSWNAGFDLWRHPDRFGELHLPARAGEDTFAPAPDPTGWPLFTWVALLLGALAGVALAGPGARLLARIGPRPKLIALGACLLVALALHLHRSWSVSGAESAVREHLSALATQAEQVAADARAAGALFSPEPAARSRALAQLLAGESIPARPGVEAAAHVPLHEDSRFADGRSKRYRIDLTSTVALPLAAPLSTRALVLQIEEEREERSRSREDHWGTLHAETSAGNKTRLPVPAPAQRAEPGTTRTHEVALALPDAGPWAVLHWAPAGGTGGLTLRGIEAAGADGDRQPVPLPATTREGVPVLAHPGGPDHARPVAPETTLALDLPGLLGGADRLWLLLRAQRAFPDLLGDHALARVEIEYETGGDQILVLRNGQHISAEALPLGLTRPAPARSRVAWQWRGTVGETLTQEALPVRLDTSRRPRALRVANLGPGGTLDLVSATLVRTRRTPPDSRVHVIRDELEPHDRMHLVASEDDFAPYLGARSSEDVAITRSFAVGGAPLSLSLHAPPAEGVARTEAQSKVGLLICLGLALFLFVLLVVDASERLHRLRQRLSLGILAAALVPLAVTLVLVERTHADRVAAEHAERTKRGLGSVQARLDAALGRWQRGARRLARHLATSETSPSPSEIRRLVRLYSGPTLPGGAARITGSELSPQIVPLGPDNEGLRGAQFLPADQESRAFHVSEWDGLVMLAPARSGGPRRWVQVDLGIPVTTELLTRALGAKWTEDGGAAAVLAADGRTLLTAGTGGDDLAQAAERALTAAALGPDQGVLLRRDIAGAQQRWLAAASPLGSEGGAPAAQLVLGLDRAGMVDALQTHRKTLLWLGLFGLALIVGVATLMAQRVAAPVRELVRVTESVRRGEFDVRVPPAGADEVGELTIAFDQMRRDLGHRVGDLDFLRRVQSDFASSLDLTKLGNRILGPFRETARADGAILLRPEGPARALAVIAADGPAARFGDRGVAPRKDGWLARAVQATGATIVDREVDGDSESAAASRLVGTWPAWTCVPLRAGDELQGLVILGYESRRGVPPDTETRLLAPLAGIAAAALGNAQLYRLAALDEVTRLPGTTAFEAALRADVEQALEGGPRAVLMRVSLDQAEHVTLRRGVDASRRLLRAAADALRGLVPDRAQLGRLRGDELAVRAPGKIDAEARELAEAIRVRMAQIEIAPEGEGESLGTTASIGIARAPEDAASAEFLLDAAARALGAAKREGGDRVEEVARVDAGVVDMPPFEDGAIFRNERMVRVVDAARRAARSEASVLITGETGTGKEVIATLIHRRSARVERPFVSVNCAAFPETLLESELFGHERGAFTGADRRREGRFELADGGTLFLDEIGEMAPSAQVKLLRVLQERQFTRLGGTHTVAVDVRIISATNQQLEAAVAAGTFREDLYYRLNVIRLELPPLRERREEIPHFVERFLRDFQRRAGGRGPRGLTPAAMDVLYRHPWPGNVRELKNAVERCAVLCEAELVGPEHLQLDGTGSAGGLSPKRAPQDDLNARQRALLDHLARHGRCTNSTYTELTGTSPRTALRDLQDLIARGLVVREGKRRGAVYRLAD